MSKDAHQQSSAKAFDLGDHQEFLTNGPLLARLRWWAESPSVSLAMRRKVEGEAADEIQRLRAITTRFDNLPHDGKHPVGAYPYSCLGCRAASILEGP